MTDRTKLTPTLKAHATAEYMFDHYLSPQGLCVLCGNSGVVDTRSSAVSGAGVRPGVRTYCLCPNGQALRKRKAAIDD